MAARCDTAPNGLTRRQALAALGLDLTYTAAQGDQLFLDDGTAVLDFLGGYGATFFGHNHPALVATLRNFLERRGVVHAQASIRSVSEHLAQRLRERLSVLGDYQIVFGNTGAEAVEIAAKHADFVYARRLRRATVWLGAAPPLNDSAELTPAARVALARAGVSVHGDLAAALARHNRQVLASAPVFLALEGSFHGKTTRALELTDNVRARFGPRVADTRTLHIAARAKALDAALAALTAPLLRARMDGEHIEIDRTDWTSAAGFFIEPVQGEGGIRPLRVRAAQHWLTVCAEKGIPLIADEIQCGLGRSGTFLYCEQLAIAPDYVLLGKSLGGGLAKISAVAIRSDQYLHEFSMLHSSTFAEDDLSACVALRALELLHEEDALRAASCKGERLRAALLALADRHPAVIREVRGRGLILGVEWQTIEFNRSNALGFIQDNGWLGYAISGYLLRAHRIRVAPALAHGHTLRIEPSYHIGDDAVTSLIDALEDVCVRLEQQDVAAIIGACLGAHVHGDRRVAPAVIRRARNGGSHVGFIGHFIDADGVALWDPGLAQLDGSARSNFLERIRPIAAPQVCHRDYVASRTGERITLSFIGIPVSSEQCDAALRGAGRRELRDLVQRALDLATCEGCSVVGLGGYASILTRNGRELSANNIALTTGNGYTVGAALLALEASAREQGLALSGAHAAVIGATGNIGAALASILARRVAVLTLIGRAARRSELEAQAGRILCDVQTQAHTAPIARLLTAAGVEATGESPAALYSRAARALGDMLPIRTAFAPEACRSAQIVIAASNTPSAVVFAEHIDSKPTVILDLAVPPNVDAGVAAQRPLARVARGGVIRTPCNPDWYVPGIPLARGEMFACMTETVLMGFERAQTHGSYGALTVERVQHTLALAAKHGFTDVRLNGNV